MDDERFILEIEKHTVLYIYMTPKILFLQGQFKKISLEHGV